jgi:hypothetical protein
MTTVQATLQGRFDAVGQPITPRDALLLTTAGSAWLSQCQPLAAQEPSPSEALAAALSLAPDRNDANGGGTVAFASKRENLSLKRGSSHPYPPSKER